ncbi:hypothetical protein OG568_46315 [Streptomyces sp. NBC_01450]|nr:hypothetical protein [Streptomyces sp. NBC_01450]
MLSGSSTRHGTPSRSSIDGADHLLTDRADARYVAIMLAARADRYARGPVRAGPT